MMYEISLIIFLFVVLAIVQLYPRRVLYETFASPQTYPACSYETASEYNVKKRELDVLLAKIEAMKTDITEGIGRVYKSIDIPYSTEQDVEPAATLVGRCHKKVIRQRDIELATDRYLIRGRQLIKALDAYYPAFTQSASQELESNVGTLKAVMLDKCLKTQPQLDMPDGVRDPAFYEPPSLEELRATSTFLGMYN
jgi:hypothetical protein